MSDITLRDFLKTYTAISNKFIDEYIDFFDMCQKYTFGILLDNVIKYLGISVVDRFYENFRKKYKINIDYMIVKINRKKRKKC